MEKEPKIIVWRLVLVMTILTICHMGIPIMALINKIRGVE